MKTVGEILETERKKQKRNLEEISRKTKIPFSTLTSIEKDDYNLLTTQPYVKGFIRNYAIELDLDPDKVLAVFRRDHTVKKRDKIMPLGLSSPLNEGFSWTPKLILILSSILVFLLIFAFLFFQVRGYLFRPPLTITSPAEGEEIQVQALQVKGKTIPDAAVYVNDQLASINFDGTFTYDLKVLPGENIIKIKAVNRRGQETEVRRRIVVDKE